MRNGSYNSNGRCVDFKTKKDDGSQRTRILVLCGSIFATTPFHNVRQMPLSLNNYLPAAIFRFGSASEDEVAFLCHLDSCAAMNTGSLTLHQWIITTYLAIVASYEQFDDASPLQPIGLDCAIPSADSSAISNQLTAIVTYKTRYVDTAGAPVELSFGLGKAIKVNVIIGLPTFKTWKLILDLEANRAT